MNVIIFGARGQLGQCLADIVSSGICAEFLSREDCDLLQPGSIKRTLDKKNPISLSTLPPTQTSTVLNPKQRWRTESMEKLLVQ